MQKFLGLIDPPNEFSSTPEWQDFLQRMKSDWPQDQPQVQEMILRAEGELLARRLSGQPEHPLSSQDARKYRALVQPPGSMFPESEQKQALVSLQNATIYPQNDPAVRGLVEQIESRLSSRQKVAAD